MLIFSVTTLHSLHPVSVYVHKEEIREVIDYLWMKVVYVHAGCEEGISLTPVYGSVLPLLLAGMILY